MNRKLFLQVWMNPIKEGILADLGATNLHTLLGLAYFINEDGECYPSEELLARVLGLKGKAPAVCLRIKSLEKVMWKGKPIIEVRRRKRIKDKTGRFIWQSNVYKLNKDLITIFSSW